MSAEAIRKTAAVYPVSLNLARGGQRLRGRGSGSDATIYQCQQQLSWAGICQQLRRGDRELPRHLTTYYIHRWKWSLCLREPNSMPNVPGRDQNRWDGPTVWLVSSGVPCGGLFAGACDTLLYFVKPSNSYCPVCLGVLVGLEWDECDPHTGP